MQNILITPSPSPILCIIPSHTCSKWFSGNMSFLNFITTSTVVQLQGGPPSPRAKGIIHRSDRSPHKKSFFLPQILLYSNGLIYLYRISSQVFRTTTKHHRSTKHLELTRGESTKIINSRFHQLLAKQSKPSINIAKS